MDIDLQRNLKKEKKKKSVFFPVQHYLKGDGKN